jgi:hypothetical protein
LEWFTPTYISSYSETDPQIGTIISNAVPVWDGTKLVTGSLTDNGTNVSTSATFTSLNITGTNTGDISIGTSNGLSLSGQTLSLAAATITTSGAMSSIDKTKLDGISNGAEVNVNADWNAITGDAEIVNKPTLGTMSAQTANDYYTKTQVDAGFQIKDTDLTTVATIGTSDQLLKVKNDGSGLEWFTPTYISSYSETDPQIGTIISNAVPVWDGATLVTGSLTDNGTNVSTSGTLTAMNLSGTNTGDVTLDKTNGLSLSSQVLSLDTATTTSNGAMSKTDKAKLSALLQGDVSLPDVQEFSSSGTWVKPAGAKYVEIYCIGGGGGGGGGAFKLFHSIRNGGEGGGGATVSSARLTSASLPSTVDITIGAGGVGGESSLADGNGNDGATGGESSFGIYVVAAGGNHGDGGCTNSSTYSSNNSFPSGMGILNCVAWKQTSANTAFFGNYSGAGGRYNTANGIVPATTFFQPSGGGAGGYNNVNNPVDISGMDGGILRTTYGSITQATGNSVSGTTVTWGDLKFGGGGTGGKSRNSAGDGYNGGDGAYPGGGGGGGGAANRSVSNKSGAGGGGGGGAVFVITYY